MFHQLSEYTCDMNKSDKLKIAHIINPVNIGSHSDLHMAQPITFESLKRAKEYAEKQGIEVKLLTAQYPEDRQIIPAYFHITEDLTQAVTDVKVFEKPRKLPFLKDILDKGYAASEGFDYVIYSNVDIAVQPYFYSFIQQTVDSGTDAFVINRRTISDANTSIDKMEQMYAEVGEDHLGHDCFVFQRAAYPKFVLEKTIIGANWIGRVLVWNLFVYANKFKEFSRANLTFHVGDDKVWKSDKLNDYYKFNFKEAQAVHHKLHANIEGGRQADNYLEHELQQEQLTPFPYSKNTFLKQNSKRELKPEQKTVKEKIKNKLIMLIGRI